VLGKNLKARERDFKDKDSGVVYCHFIKAGGIVEQSKPRKGKGGLEIREFRELGGQKTDSTSYWPE